MTEEDEYEEEDETPLPWPKIAIAAVVLAATAGVYFAVQHYRVGRQLDAAERLIAEQKHDEAVVVLDKALANSPGSGRALLLKMKAELLRGNWQGADALAQQNDGKTVKGELGGEVQQLTQRAQSAVRAWSQAGELFARGELEKAELLLSEAVGLYPESAQIRESLASVQGTLAFQKKNYPAFLKIAEEAVHRRPESPAALALLASALSAQYAATGDAKHRTQAEQVLEKAGQVSQGGQAKALYEEYAPRIRHRLETRQIIDRGEYDRRFRAAATAGKNQ